MLCRTLKLRVTKVLGCNKIVSFYTEKRRRRRKKHSAFAKMLATHVRFGENIVRVTQTNEQTLPASPNPNAT